MFWLDSMKQDNISSKKIVLTIHGDMWHRNSLIGGFLKNWVIEIQE